MNKNIVKLAAVAFALLVLATPALGTLTADEAAQALIDTTYMYGHDHYSMFGFTYQNNKYYHAELTRGGTLEGGMSTGGTLSGVLIINAETGELVTDEETAKKISYARAYLIDMKRSEIEDYRAGKELYTTSATICRQKVEIYKQELPHFNTADQQKLRTIVQSYQEAAIVFDELADLFGKIILVMEDIADGKASYENVMLLTDYIDEYEKLLNKLDGAYENMIADASTYFDILIEGASRYGVNANQMSDNKINTTNELNLERELLITLQIRFIEEERERLKQRVDTDIKLMNEVIGNNEIRNDEVKNNEIPGFGILLALCALIGLALFTRRKKA